MTSKKKPTTKDLQDGVRHLKADGKTVSEKLGPKGKKAPAKKSAGRPRVTQELLEKVIERMCEGESLIQICRDPKMPSRGTVLNYAMMRRDSEEEWVQRFSQAYEIAKQVRAEGWADEMLEISDMTSPEEVQKSRLQVDTRKWLVGKLLNQYADKSRHELSGPEGKPIQSESSVTFYLPDNGRKDSSLEDKGEE